jgi:hypothetical protein
MLGQLHRVRIRVHRNPQSVSKYTIEYARRVQLPIHSQPVAIFRISHLDLHPSYSIQIQSPMNSDSRIFPNNSLCNTLQQVLLHHAGIPPFLGSKICQRWCDKTESNRPSKIPLFDACLVAENCEEVVDSIDEVLIDWERKLHGQAFNAVDLADIQYFVALVDVIDVNKGGKGVADNPRTSLWELVEKIDEKIFCWGQPARRPATQFLKPRPPEACVVLTSFVV